MLFVFQDSTIFDTWFRIDIKPFKQALLNIVKRWSFMFKQHLIDHVTNSLNDLENFIKVQIDYSTMYSVYTIYYIVVHV